MRPDRGPALFGDTALHAALSPAFCLIRLDDVGSTNEEAKRYAERGANDGTLIWAESQSAGRGRRGRAWTSPPGNLYMSLLIRPEAPPERALQLGFAVSLAIAEGIEEHVPDESLSGTAIRVKWPNDVLVNGAKVCGILLESSMRADGAGLDWMVIGMGVNLKHAPEDTPFPATTLVREGIDPVSAGDLLISVTGRFEIWRKRWAAGGFAPVRAAWLARAAGLGEAVDVRLPDGTLKGVFDGIDETGALLLRTESGATTPVSMGDVFPAGTGDGGST